MHAKRSLRRPIFGQESAGTADPKPEAALQSDAASHVCPICGETVRASDLGAALYHQRPNHKPDDRRG